MEQPEFLPTTREEMRDLGWDELDVLLISGDAYVDSHSFGTSLLGRWLVENGYRVGIVAQPGWENTADVSRLGRPLLFAGISAGSVDSLLAHYTAFRKKRGQDAYSPGGAVDLRPNRASIVYAGLARRAFPGLPVILGGIEASLRRASHYDFWSDSLRRSIVLDSKADAVLYGMGERSILAVAELFSSAAARQKPAEAVARARLRGTAYAVHPDNLPAAAEELPSHEAILANPAFLVKSAMAFERQMLRGGPCLVQRSGGRAVVFEPPSAPLSTPEMDRVYGLPFTRRPHPSYREAIPAVAMLEGSVASHRGCAGGCSFCALASHQGRLIQSRSAGSILAEIERMTGDADWKGAVTDVGGPSSNMWNARCAIDAENCGRESCLFPKRCRNFKADQEGQAELLRRIGKIGGVKHVRVASGVRHDLALESEPYLDALVGEFTGGQLKIAPEHISEKVLRLMRKPPIRLWERFLKTFDKLSEAAGKEQYVVPYLMSAFPGTTDRDMEELAAWLRRRGWRPQQVQCFIPTPGTVATAMFFAGVDTEGRTIPVARTDAERLRQHGILVPDEAPRPGRDRRAKNRGTPPGPGRPSGAGAGRSARDGGKHFGEKKRFEKKDAAGTSYERPPRGDGGKHFGEKKRFEKKDAAGTPYERPPRGDGGKHFGEKKRFEKKDAAGTPYERPPRGDDGKHFGEKKRFEKKDAAGTPYERPPRGDGGKRFGEKKRFEKKDAAGTPYGRPPRGDGPAHGGRKESGPRKNFADERKSGRPAGRNGTRPGGRPGFDKDPGGRKPGFGGRGNGPGRGRKPGGGGRPR